MKYIIYIYISFSFIVCARQRKDINQLLREHATERYENCCDEGYPLRDANGRAGIFHFDLKMLKKTGFFGMRVLWTLKAICFA